mgnify:CR=1 FL=1
MRLYVVVDSASSVTVSIHAPTWGATNVGCPWGCFREFQSTHPRGVRRSAPSMVPDIGSLMFQSTHPRGVRPFDDKLETLHNEFQSTHPRGVRHKSFCSSLISYKFQSTHPRGVRQSILTCIRFLQKFQSTHPRGVRLLILIVAIEIFCFNPRTHVGCD